MKFTFHIWARGQRWKTTKRTTTPKGYAYIFENLENNDVAFVHAFTGKRIHYTTKHCYIAEQFMDRKDLFKLNKGMGFIGR